MSAPTFNITTTMKENRRKETLGNIREIARIAELKTTIDISCPSLNTLVTFIVLADAGDDRTVALERQVFKGTQPVYSEDLSITVPIHTTVERLWLDYADQYIPFENNMKGRCATAIMIVIKMPV